MLSIVHPFHLRVPEADTSPGRSREGFATNGEASRRAADAWAAIVDVISANAHAGDSRHHDHANNHC